MIEQEILVPTTLYCDVGQVEATVLVANGFLEDNAKTITTETCNGCKHWSRGVIREVEQDIRDFWGEGSVNNDRFPLLRQHIVDQSRFISRKVESKLIVGTCTPLGVGL